MVRVPNSNDWAAFNQGYIINKDLAYLSAVTHPDHGYIEPSADDRDFLKYIGQKKSIIISYFTGYEMEFTSNIFDDYMEGGN